MLLQSLGLQLLGKKKQGDRVIFEANFSLEGDNTNGQVFELLGILGTFDLEFPEDVHINSLEDRDWLAENRKSFPLKHWSVLFSRIPL